MTDAELNKRLDALERELRELRAKPAVNFDPVEERARLIKGIALSPSAHLGPFSMADEVARGFADLRVAVRRHLFDSFYGDDQARRASRERLCELVDYHPLGR